MCSRCVFYVRPRNQRPALQPLQDNCPMLRNKKGFTLIELLIVVVIIGILAAIAIPKFANTKDKAYVAAMKSDLRNMATYEEQYAADNGGAYFGGTATSASPRSEERRVGKECRCRCMPYH